MLQGTLGASGPAGLLTGTLLQDATAPGASLLGHCRLAGSLLVLGALLQGGPGASVEAGPAGLLISTLLQGATGASLLGHCRLAGSLLERTG